MTKSFEDFKVMNDLKGFLTPEEVRTVIIGADFGDRLRNKMLIKTLAYTGRRVSEVVGLKQGKEVIGGLRPCDIDVDHNQILWCIIKKKGGEKRWIPAPPELIDNLVKYINISIIKREDRIFPITRQRVFQIIRMAGFKCGINIVGSHKIHPHHFRHSYAISLLRNNTPLHEIKKLLAHSTIMITESYLKIAPEDVRFSANKIGDIYKKKELID